MKIVLLSDHLDHCWSCLTDDSMGLYELCFTFCRGGKHRVHGVREKHISPLFTASCFQIDALLVVRKVTKQEDLLFLMWTATSQSGVNALCDIIKCLCTSTK